MPSPSKVPGIVRAAQELEDTVVQLVNAVGEAGKIHLNSEKHLGQAGRALQKAAGLRDQLGERLKEMLDAIHSVRNRAESASAGIEAQAEQLRHRLETLKSLQARAGGIGEAAREVTGLVKAGRSKAEIKAGLEPVEAKIDEMSREAKAAEFEDVARDLDALRQMLKSLRGKLDAS